MKGEALPNFQIDQISKFGRGMDSTPTGLGTILRLPRVAAARQPWATCLQPFQGCGTGRILRYAQDDGVVLRVPSEMRLRLAQVSSVGYSSATSCALRAPGQRVVRATRKKSEAIR
jgi:hypothetical protein